LIESLNNINIQLLTEIEPFIFDDSLKIYFLYDNIVRDIALNTNLKWIPNNTYILEKLVDGIMKMCNNWDPIQNRVYRAEEKNSSNCGKM